MRIKDFQALTFDCYGTLIDWETGLLDCLRPWAKSAGIDADDETLLQAFSEAESRCERSAPADLYPDILRSVHHTMADHFGTPPDDAEADKLARSVGDWPPFPDTVAALKRLKRAFRLVVISNVDRASFHRTQQTLQVEFDTIVTAEEVGAYKPDHRMFLHAFEVLERAGVTRDRILHLAQSMYHDHAPAKDLGMCTVWVDRRGDRPGGGATPLPTSLVRPDLVVRSLAEFVHQLDNEP